MHASLHKTIERTIGKYCWKSCICWSAYPWCRPNCDGNRLHSHCAVTVARDDRSVWALDGHHFEWNCWCCSTGIEASIAPALLASYLAWHSVRNVYVNEPADYWTKPILTHKIYIYRGFSQHVSMLLNLFLAARTMHVRTMDSDHILICLPVFWLRLIQCSGLTLHVCTHQDNVYGRTIVLMRPIVRRWMLYEIVVAFVLVECPVRILYH